MEVGSSRPGVAARRCKLQVGAGNSKSVVGAGMPPLGAGADSRLQAVVVWHKVPVHSR
jgi:hypothetical protein